MSVKVSRRDDARVGDRCHTLSITIPITTTITRVGDMCHTLGITIGITQVTRFFFLPKQEYAQKNVCLCFKDNPPPTPLPSGPNLWRPPSPAPWWIKPRWASSATIGFIPVCTSLNNAFSVFSCKHCFLGLFLCFVKTFNCLGAFTVSELWKVLRVGQWVR